MCRQILCYFNSLNVPVYYRFLTHYELVLVESEKGIPNKVKSDIAILFEDVLVTIEMFKPLILSTLL